MSSKASIVRLKAAVWGAALLPFALLVRGAIVGELGADPVETLLHETGTWALVLLLVTLTVTPVRRFTGWNAVVKLRRLLGLFSYFYATLHVVVYLVLDQGLAVGFILEDVAERPYVTAGACAFVILGVLAATSTRGWIRRLGKSWRRLHRLVYAAGALGVLHFAWQEKVVTFEVLAFAAVYGALMLARTPRRSRRRPRSGAALSERAEPAASPGPGR